MHLVVLADGGGRPPAKVPAGVAEVQLEAVVPVPARVQERHAEGPQAAVLRVRLLVVAHADDELLHGDVLQAGKAPHTRAHAPAVNREYQNQCNRATNDPPSRHTHTHRKH